jgi:hypothetical protein
MAFDRAERGWLYQRDEIRKRALGRRRVAARLASRPKIPCEVSPGRDGGVVVIPEATPFLWEE